MEQKLTKHKNWGTKCILSRKRKKKKCSDYIYKKNDVRCACAIMRICVPRPIMLVWELFFQLVWKKKKIHRAGVGKNSKCERKNIFLCSEEVGRKFYSHPKYKSKGVSKLFNLLSFSFLILLRPCVCAASSKVGRSANKHTFSNFFSEGNLSFLNFILFIY